MCLFIILILACFSVAESSELRGVFDKPNTNTGFANGDDPDSIGFDAVGNTGNGGGFGSSNNPGQSHRRFGPQGLILEEVVKSDPPVFENSDQKKIRALFLERRTVTTLATPAELKAKRASWNDDYTCKYNGDDTIYKADYCYTILDTMNPTDDFVVITTIGSIIVKGDTATAYIHAHAVGKVPFLGMDASYDADVEMIVVRKDDSEWKFSRFNYILEGTADDVFGRMRSEVKTALRNSIYSAKQQYPAYNPIIIVGGSAVTAFLGLVIFAVWILRKRRGYKNVDSVTDV